MLTRYLFLIFIQLSLISCARHAPIQSVPQIPQNKMETRKLSTFNRVDVLGTINVSLHTGYKRPAVVLRGDSRDLRQVVTEVRNGNTLYVLVKKGAPRFGSLSIDIRSRHLNGLTYKGAGTINGRNIHSSLLDLNIDNPEQTSLAGYIVLKKLQASGGGNIILKGVYSRYLQLEISGKTRVLLTGLINLSKLDLKGDGWLGMYWVKSPLLNICLKGKTTIQMAGVVEKLDVELWDQAQFKGRYLRAINAFVKTHGKSVAEISAIKHQHALATDSSDIYFYKIPETKADFMAFQGSILDMRDLSLPFLESYTRFNKETH